MSALPEADDRLTGNDPPPDFRLALAGRITWGFDLALFAFSAALGIGRFLLSGRAGNAYLPGVILSVGLDLVRLVVVLGITAYFVAEFWRRLIAPLAAVRPITSEEAVAIVLMVGASSSAGKPAWTNSLG